MLELYNPVTVWSIDGEHSHIEDGWAKGDTPTIKHPEQIKMWKGRNWIKAFKYLKQSRSDVEKEVATRLNNGYIFVRKYATPRLVNVIE